MDAAPVSARSRRVVAVRPRAAPPAASERGKADNLQGLRNAHSSLSGGDFSQLKAEGNVLFDR